MLIDQISDKPGEVVLRQPLVQRRRDQQQLVRLGTLGTSIRRPALHDRRFHRRHFEKTLIIPCLWHTEVSEQPSNQQAPRERVTYPRSEELHHQGRPAQPVCP
jgi:hypothetical protein